jgi:hypothetical protein
MSVLHTNPRRFARIAGAFYLLVFVFGIAALNTAGDTRFAANLLLAAVVYYVVTLTLYQLCWITYVHPPLAKRLGLLAMAPGMVGEGVLTFWLLAAGVDPERWRAQSIQSKA